MLLFDCPHCGQPMDADDSFAGMEADCPVCGEKFVILGVEASQTARATEIPPTEIALAPPATAQSLVPPSFKEPRSISGPTLPPPQDPPLPAAEVASQRNPAPPHEKVTPLAPHDFQTPDMDGLETPLASLWPRRAIWATVLCWLIGLGYYAVTLWSGLFLEERRFDSGTVTYTAGQSIILVLACAFVAFVISLPLAVVGLLFRRRFPTVLWGVYSLLVLLLPNFTVAWMAATTAPIPYLAFFAPAPEEATGKGIWDAALVLGSDLAGAIRSGKDGEKYVSILAPRSEVERLHRILDAWNAPLAPMAGNYKKELGELALQGLGGLISADRVAADPDLKHLRDILERSRGLAVRDLAQCEALEKKLPGRIVAAEFAKGVENTIDGDVGQALAKSTRLNAGHWDCEVRIADACGAVMDHLDACRGRWRVAQGKFEFEKTPEFQEHRRMVGIIDLIVEEEKKLDQESVAMQREIEGLDKLVLE